VNFGRTVDKEERWDRVWVVESIQPVDLDVILVGGSKFMLAVQAIDQSLDFAIFFFELSVRLMRPC
jgi:hypothetical protein